VRLACYTRLHNTDRYQRQRRGLAVHCQQLLKVPQCLTQAFDAALLPAPDYGVSATEVNVHGRASKKFEHGRIWT
jgi:hypothetical protein